jgi:excisionase family DNA binding protein
MRLSPKFITRSRQRLSVGEAADELGVSVDAIRSRVKRGTIPHIRRGGRVWVLLGGDQGSDQGNRPQQDQSASDALISEMRDRIQFLEDELRRRGDEAGELRRIIAALTSRIPTIEAPETVEEASEGAEPHPGTGEPQGGVQRPWWRRVFGG